MYTIAETKPSIAYTCINLLTVELSRFYEYSLFSVHYKSGTIHVHVCTCVWKKNPTKLCNSWWAPFSIDANSDIFLYVCEIAKSIIFIKRENDSVDVTTTWKRKRKRKWMWTTTSYCTKSTKCSYHILQKIFLYLIIYSCYCNAPDPHGCPYHL